jgi:signal transduction histidine kinase
MKPEDLKAFFDHHETIPVDSKEQCTFEFQITTRSGEKKWIEHICQPVFDSTGIWLGRRASNRDITSRQQTEEDLLAERVKLEQMLRHKIMLSEVAARLNTVEPLSLVTDSVFELIGNAIGLDGICIRQLDEDMQSATKLISWKSNTHSAPCDDCSEIINRTEVPNLFDSVLEGGITTCTSLEDLKKDEQEFFRQFHFQSISAFPLIVENGVKGFIIYGLAKPHEWIEIEVYLLGAVSNMITNAWQREIHSKGLVEAERKRAEAIQLAEKSSRLAALGTLAAGIAHEINQPLTALKIEVDGTRHLLKHKKEKVVREHVKTLEFISEQASRISEIIVHMRALARQEKQADSTALDLNNTVSRALSLIDEQLYSHGIKLETCLDNSIPELMSHGTIIEQVVINLVVNAMHVLQKHRAGEGAIKVSTKQSEGHAIIEVLDNGPGIPNQDLEHIFDPFFTTKPVGEGMGLGLSITENLVRGLGGHTRVSNSAGDGAVFTVTLPNKPLPQKGIENEYTAK